MPALIRDEADEAVRLHEISRPVIEEVPVDNTIEPPEPEYGAQWLDEQPAPPEYWDSQFDTGLLYRWEYREAGEGETKIVLCFPLPERDSWESFRKHDEVFRNATDDFDVRLANPEEMAEQFIGHCYNMKPTEVPENWMKAWVLLVWAGHNQEEMVEPLGERLTTYFDGVAIPVPTRGGLAIRELKTDSTLIA